MKKIIASTIASLLLIPSFSQAGETTELEILYTDVNPDYSPFPNGDGVALGIEHNFDNGLFATGYFNSADFTASGPEVGREEVNSWFTAGVGYRFDKTEGFYSLLTLESVDTESESYDGFGIHLGYQADFSENWAGLLQVGYIDTEFSDYHIKAKLLYRVSDDIALTIGLRDYHEWDYVSYEGGVVWRF